MPAKRINNAKLSDARTITPHLTGMRHNRDVVATMRRQLTDKPSMLARVFRIFGL
jgi:hypothetical protein